MKNVINIIDNAIKAQGIEYWGYCEFEKFKTRLLDCRAKNLLPQNPKTIISVIFPYYTGKIKRNISYYAVSRDYHFLLLPKLKELAKSLSDTFKGDFFVPFLDNSPLPEVSTAVECSLGVKGDNGLLINSKYGSFVFIGEIVTTLILPAKRFHLNKRQCLHCKKCSNICPTGAIHDGVFNKELCLSHISQKKGDLSDNEITALKKGRLVWGCDLCQEACPLNENISCTSIEAFYKDCKPIIGAGDCDRLSNRAFQWRKSSVIERNIKIMQDKQI